MGSSTTSQSLTGTLALATFTATLSWFAAGYVNVVLNVPQTVIVTWLRWVECGRLSEPENSTTNYLLWCETPTTEEEPFILRDNFKLNTIWAVVNSIVGVGMIISLFTCTFFVHRLGLKGTMFLTSGTIIVGAIFSTAGSFVHIYELFIVGRLISGFGQGINGVVGPIYLSEIAPVRLRGAVGTLPIIMLILGMLTANVLGLPMTLGTTSRWPVLIAFECVPVILMCIFLPLCPDSPRRLFMVKGDKAEATKALMRLRGTPYVDEELATMQKEVEEEGDVNIRTPVPLWGMFKDRFLRSVLVLCSVPMFAKQFSGFMCILYFSTSMLTEIGLDGLYSAYATIGIWTVNLLFTLLSMVLIDRAGRKSLLIISHMGMIIALTSFTVFMVMSGASYQLTWAKYGCAGSMLFYMASYSIGSGSIPWILPAELFPQEARTAAMTVIGVLCAAAGLFTALLFPVAVILMQEYTFLIFVVSVVLATFHIIWKLPETKGKSIEEIQTLLRHRLR